MPLDVLAADLVRVTRIDVDGAEPCRVDAQERTFDLMVRLLQRDDPLRRLYLRKRWQSTQRWSLFCEK